MAQMWSGTPMISCDQGNSHHVCQGKTEDLAVLNEILGVLVVGARAHIATALMKECGNLKKQGVTLSKVMQCDCFLEELATQPGYLVSMIDIDFISFSEDPGRTDNLVLEADGESWGARKVRQESAFVIAARNSQEFQPENLRDGEICKECGDNCINGMIIELVTLDALLFGNLGHFPCEGLQGPEGGLRVVILGQEGDEVLDLVADGHQILNTLVFVLVENLANLS